MEESVSHPQKEEEEDENNTRNDIISIIDEPVLFRDKDKKKEQPHELVHHRIIITDH